MNRNYCSEIANRAIQDSGNGYNALKTIELLFIKTRIYGNQNY
jgi:hypothetical protein